MFVVVAAEMEGKSKNWICDSEEKDVWPLVKLQNVYVKSRLALMRLLFIF